VSQKHTFAAGLEIRQLVLRVLLGPPLPLLAHLDQLLVSRSGCLLWLGPSLYQKKKKKNRFHESFHFTTRSAFNSGDDKDHFFPRAHLKDPLEDSSASVIVRLRGKISSIPCPTLPVPREQTHRRSYRAEYQSGVVRFDHIFAASPRLIANAICFSVLHKDEVVFPFLHQSAVVYKLIRCGVNACLMKGAARWGSLAPVSKCSTPTSSSASRL
jgi:hypothetical protein